VGGTESATRALAHGLVRHGHEAVIVAGTLRHEQGFRRSLELDHVAGHASGAPSEAGGRAIRVHKIHRADLYFDHWQKSASARASLAFRDVLREERPDLVHVQHWIRLSRDLVQRAAQERIPSVVTLHDLWTTCLVTFRVKPESGEFCEAPLAPSPCIRCAAQVPPRTPWLSYEAQGVALLERSADLARELELARAVLAPTRAHAEAVARYLGLAGARMNVRVVPHGRDLALRPRAPLAPPSGSQELVLGAWGHLYRLKGLDRVLRALHLLRDPARVALHVAGGEPEAAYAREVHELARGLEVRFHGPFEGAALDRHPVGRVHAFVSGTRAHESWGLVLDEAVALRLPLVLPRSGAYAERLREGGGALFYEPGSEAGLAAVLERLLDEPALLSALREALPAARDFTPSTEDNVRAHLAVYEDALRAGPLEVSPPPERERLWQAAEDAFGRELPRRTAEELGFARDSSREP
jgi:glycosyltransferase involved in cell wall biosynthesis